MRGTCCDGWCSRTSKRTARHGVYAGKAHVPYNGNLAGAGQTETVREASRCWQWVVGVVADAVKRRVEVEVARRNE